MRWAFAMARAKQGEACNLQDAMPVDKMLSPERWQDFKISKHKKKGSLATG
jgi:hypothetical protein